jgi:hypothetical protein
MARPVATVAPQFAPNLDADHRQLAKARRRRQPSDPGVEAQ